MKLSQKDLTVVFGKPWQDEFTNQRALECFETDEITINYQEKDHLATSSLLMEARNKLYKILIFDSDVYKP